MTITIFLSIIKNNLFSVYQIKTEYTSESDSEKPRRMADLSHRKYEGIGPVSKDGMPLILRSVSSFLLFIIIELHFKHFQNSKTITIE